MDVAALLALLQPSMTQALNEIILLVLATLPTPRKLPARQARAEKLGFLRHKVCGIPGWMGAEEAQGFLWCRAELYFASRSQSLVGS